MIDRLIVENFRCFKHLELNNLARVNVVGGQNASGKTALLESLFLAAAGNPEILIRMRQFRGYSEGQIGFYG